MGYRKSFREFLHVDDLGDASVFVLENWKPSTNEPTFLNVGTGVDISIRSLAELVANATGFQGEIIWDDSKPDGTPKKQLNVSRLTNLGWKPSITLAEGLKKTVAVYKNDAERNQLRG